MRDVPKKRKGLASYFTPQAVHHINLAKKRWEIEERKEKIKK